MNSEDNPILVFTKLAWCEERQSFHCVCFKARLYSLIPRPRRKVWVESFFEGMCRMKREAQEVQKKQGKFIPLAEPILKGLPRLNEYLGDAFWDDGSPRDVCSISVRWDGSNCTVSLVDKENERSMTTTSASFQEALEAMEAHISRSGPAWRNWGKPKKR